MNVKRESGESGGWRGLYPFASRYFQQSGAVRQHYVDESSVDKDRGRLTLLMVHGNPTWSFYFHALIADVARWGRAVAVDHVGCGLSDRPADWPYHLGGKIEDLCRLVEQLDLRNVVLVGHDWGGAIGMGCLVRMQERFSGIVLMNTAAFPPPFFPWRIRILQTPGLGRIAVQGLNVFSRAALSMATERKGGLPDAVAAGLLTPYDSWSRRRAVFEFVRDIPVRATQPTWRELAAIEARLQGLTMPKLLVWGMRDWCFRPECLQRFAGHWPDAKQLRLESAGHYVLLDEPEEVVSAIREFARPLSRNAGDDQGH